MQTKGTLSLITWVLCCVFLLSSTFLTKKWNEPGSQAVLSWDVSGYYMYLPSLFYDDLGQLHNKEYILDNYAPSGSDFYQAIQQPDGKYVMKYSSGLSVMYLPGFAAAHVWAKMAGYPVDGFSYPYQFAINLWSILVSFIGLWFIRKLLLKYFDDRTTMAVLLVLAFATNYFHYVSYNGSLTHNYLFTLYALLLYFTDRWYARQQLRQAIAIGLLSGLAVLTRPTELICVLPVLLWGVSSIAGLRERIKLLLSRWGHVLVYGACAAAVGSIQLIYWKLYSGHFLYYSYQEESFSWLSPHLFDGFLSYRKGWFIYTPIMVFSLIGLIPLWRYHRQLFWSVVSLAIPAIYICFAWDIWWYGGSFSQRSVVQYYAILSFPLAAIIHQYAFRRWWTMNLAAAIFLFCTWLNLLMSWQATSRSGFMESDIMSRAYYWRIFGKTAIEINDRKLLDTDEELPDRLMPKLAEIYSNDLENDSSAPTAITTSGTRAIMLDQQGQYSPKLVFPLKDASGWLRLSAEMHYPKMEWNMWKWTQFRIVLVSKGERVKSKMIRVQRTTQPGSWQKVFVDIEIPDDKKVDSVEIAIWNADSDKEIFFDDLKVEQAIEH